jgi:molecular chaperone DnaK
MGYAIGIDLGSTFSVVSYVNEEDHVEVIPNDLGERITPSVVSFGDEVYVGQYAVDMEQQLPFSHTIRVVKRHMGTNKRFVIEDKSYSPEEISSYILKYLKSCAERHLGVEVTEAVITVPAYFNNDQRQSTKTAGELAGLKVLRIINEPTAASLAYGLDKKNDATILVYDLGGGTFDVTLLKLMDGVDFHVQSTSGNTSLGGVDFDKELSNLILEKFNKQNGFVFDADDNTKQRLRDCAEKVKKQLSSMQKTNALINNFTYYDNKPVNLNVPITREEFESAIKIYIDKTLVNVSDALRDANIKTNQIDEVVFVGGSTRIPLIERVIEEKFGKKPNKSINPDEAVSVGAAIQASVLTGKSSREVYLLDVCPLSLGVETQGGIMSILISRNTQVPAVVKEIFTTAYDNQTSVDVKIYQGERPKTVDNLCLGEFKLDGIEEKPRGLPKIEVSFAIDANGILSVNAQDLDTGVQKDIEITGQASLSNEEISKIINDAQKHKEEDEYFRKITNLHDLLYDCEIQIEELLRTNVLNKDDNNDLLDLKYSLKQDGKSQNIELLSSLLESAKETIKEKSFIVHEAAKEKAKL